MTRAQRVRMLVEDRVDAVVKVLLSHGHTARPGVEYTESPSASSLAWHLTVGGHAIYTIVVSVESTEHMWLLQVGRIAETAVRGAWLIDGLRSAGLLDVANDVDTHRGNRPEKVLN